MSAPFDYFIALDGHGLNGFEGYAGVARMRHEAGLANLYGRM